MPSSGNTSVIATESGQSSWRRGAPEGLVVLGRCLDGRDVKALNRLLLKERDAAGPRVPCWRLLVGAVVVEGDPVLLRGAPGHGLAPDPDAWLVWCQEGRVAGHRLEHVAQTSVVLAMDSCLHVPRNALVGDVDYKFDRDSL